MKTETAQDKDVRANQKIAAVRQQYPGHRGPAVYYWKPDSNSFQFKHMYRSKNSGRYIQILRRSFFVPLRMNETVAPSLKMIWTWITIMIFTLQLQVMSSLRMLLG